MCYGAVVSSLVKNQGAVASAIAPTKRRDMGVEVEGATEILKSLMEKSKGECALQNNIDKLFNSLKNTAKQQKVRGIVVMMFKEEGDPITEMCGVMYRDKLYREMEKIAIQLCV